MMFQKHMPLLAITTTIPCTAIRARKQGNSVHRALCTLDAKYTQNHVTKLRPQASLNYMSGCEQASELRRMGGRRRLTAAGTLDNGTLWVDAPFEGKETWVNQGWTAWADDKEYALWHLTTQGKEDMKYAFQQTAKNTENIEELTTDLEALDAEVGEKFTIVNQNIAENNTQIGANEANIQILEEFLLDQSIKGHLEDTNQTLSDYLLETIQAGDAALEAKIGDIPLDAKGNTQTVTQYLVGLVQENTDYIDERVGTLSSLILDNATEAELSQTGGTLSEFLLQKIQDGDNKLQETIGNLPEEYESVTAYLEDLVATNKELIDSHATSIQTNADNIESLSNLILDEATNAELHKNGLTLSEHLVQKIQEGDQALEDMINLPDGETSVTDYLKRLVGENKTLIDEEVKKIEAELHELELIDTAQNAEIDALQDINNDQAGDLDTLFQQDLALTGDVSNLQGTVTGLTDDVGDIEDTLSDHTVTIAQTEVTAADNTKGLEQLGTEFENFQTTVDADLDAQAQTLQTDIAIGDQEVMNLSNLNDATIAEVMNLKFAHTDSAVDSLEKDFQSEVDSLEEDFDNKVENIEEDFENQVTSLEADFDLKIEALEAELAELKSGDVGAADMEGIDQLAAMDMTQLSQGGIDIDIDLGGAAKKDGAFEMMEIFSGMEWWHFLFIGLGAAIIALFSVFCKSRQSDVDERNIIPLYM